MKIIRKRSDKNIKRNKRKIIFAILLVTILLVTILIMLLSTQITYAKYQSLNKEQKTMQIATPIFIVDGGETTKISEINNIGYYEFSIKNFNESNISETGFLYTIEIVSNTDEAIRFELYNEDILIPLEDLKSEELSIIGNEKVEQKYKLKVTYDNTKGDKGKDILEEVQVKVHSEQERI